MADRRKSGSTRAEWNKNHSRPAWTHQLHHKCDITIINEIGFFLKQEHVYVILRSIFLAFLSEYKYGAEAALLCWCKWNTSYNRGTRDLTMDLQPLKGIQTTHTTVRFCKILFLPLHYLQSRFSRIFIFVALLFMLHTLAFEITLR